MGGGTNNHTALFRVATYTKVQEVSTIGPGKLRGSKSHLSGTQVNFRSYSVSFMGPFVSVVTLHGWQILI